MSGILVGDIGGTHTRLARARVGAGSVSLDAIERFDNVRYDRLESILSEYTGRIGPFERCCLAVAGPTDGERVSFTNRDWQIETRTLAGRFNFSRALLVNDFAAVGWGLNVLAPQDQTVLQPGSNETAMPRLALGAGTGLGVSICTWQGGRYVPLASEGGHIGFAPVDAEQEALLHFLQRQHGRVSVERILSGPGIATLYRFCLHQAGRSEAGNPLLESSEPPQAISSAGLNGNDAVAEAALRLFASILGQTAGDLALVAGAAGGVFIAGGIAPKLLPVLQGSWFLAGFNDKGRFASWAEQRQVVVVLDQDIGLKGAAVAGASAAPAKN